MMNLQRLPASHGGEDCMCLRSWEFNCRDLCCSRGHPWWASQGNGSWQARLKKPSMMKQAEGDIGCPLGGAPNSWESRRWLQQGKHAIGPLLRSMWWVSMHQSYHVKITHWHPPGGGTYHTHPCKKVCGFWSHLKTHQGGDHTELWVIANDKILTSWSNFYKTHVCKSINAQQ